MKGGDVVFITIMELFIMLLLVMGLKLIDNFFKGDKNRNFYRMISIAVGINLMVLTFLIITFKKIQFAPGPHGPSGNRGDKGFMGNTNNYNICSKQVVTAGDKKFKILKQQNAVAKVPSLDLDDDIIF
jgi:hypothetical protein